VLFDYDSDSDPDLFLNNHYTRPLFYDNQGATMQKRKFPVLVASGHTVYDRHNCMWGEANFDGRPDFYCSSGAQRGRGEGPNQLLLQSSSGFSNATNDYRVADKFGRGRSANWLDFNRDGRLDIYVGNRTRAGAPNVMFRRGRDRFVRADVGLTESFPVVGSYWSDYNLNGYPDLLVLADDKPTVFYRNVGGRFHRTSVPGVTGYPWDSAAWGHYNGDKRSDLALVTQRRLVVMRNKGGSGSPFHEVFRAGLKLGRSVAWFDADNDGDLDLFVVQGRNDGANRGDLLFLRTANGFRRIRRPSTGAARLGDGDGVSTGDIDGDGREDLVVSNGFKRSRGRPDVLRNVGSSGSWIKVRLNGGARNPNAYGAFVQVQTEGRSYWRAITDGAVNRSQSAVNPVHLGIAGAGSASVRVEWPTGGADCVSNIAATQLVEIARGSSLCGN
jgi:hypothetical protein